MERRKQSAQRRQRIRHGPAELPTVYCGLEHANLDLAVDEPTKRGRQRRPANCPVLGIGHDDHIGVEGFAVRGKEVDEVRRAQLLLALDDELHTDGRSPLEDAQRAEVGDDPGLVVGRASTVQAAAAFDRLEGRRLPLLGRAGRLHVVVRVEQHARGPGRRRGLGEHGRRRAVDLK